MADTTLLGWQYQRLAALDLPVWHSGPEGIVDAWPDFRGPLAGLYSALVQHPEPSFWLVVPVDMPVVPLDRLHRLIRHTQDESLPVAYSNAPLPLSVTVTSGLVDTLATWLDRPDGPRSLRALMSHFNGRWLAEPLADQDRCNLNTPEDWAEFQKVTDLQPGSSGKPTGDTGE